MNVIKSRLPRRSVIPEFTLDAACGCWYAASELGQRCQISFRALGETRPWEEVRSLRRLMVFGPGLILEDARRDVISRTGEKRTRSPDRHLL